MATNTLGTLLIELKAKTDAFEKGMKSARDLSFTTAAEIVGSLEQIGKGLLNLRFNSLNQVGKSLSIVGGIATATGAALTTSIIAVAIKSANEIDAMGKSAEKAGMGIQVFSEYAYAAKRADIPIEDFTNSMAKLNKTALAAAQGNTQAQQALKLAGTSATDAAGKLRPTDAILADIIKRYDGLTDKTLKSALAQQVFGKSGAVLIPFLNQGTKGIEALRKEADALGVAIGPQLLAQAQQFHDSIEQIEAGAKGMALQFSAGVLPALNDIVGAMIKVEGHTSPMRSFGEQAGEVFRGMAKAAYAAYIGIQQLKIALYEEPKAIADKAPMWQRWTGIAQLRMMFGSDPDSQKKFAALQKQYDDFVLKLEAGSPIRPQVEKPAKGTSNLNPEATNFADKEIQKLREKAQANLALAAAQLIGEQSVRATSAANQADAIILQIATNASKEHKTALEAEIAAAQKKYGAAVLSLVAIEQEAARNQAFNKTLSDQTDEANISADAHKRMAAAIMQGGAAITEASIANQIDALVKKADLKLTQDQIDALNKLKDAKRADADEAISEAISRETVSLTNAAHATQLLIAAQREGNDAEIEARAQLEAENFAIQNNIDLKDKRIATLKDEIAANMRAQQSQGVGANLQAQYDPESNYRRSIDQINQAERDRTISAETASAARRDAYRREQEQIDQVSMATHTGAAGASVALREWLRSAQNWAQNMHDAVGEVMQGFDSGFRNAFDDMIMGTKTVGQAFAEMGRTMLRSITDALAGIVAKWIETKIILATLKLFGIDPGTNDPNAKAQEQIQANAAEASSYAGLAAAEEFEWQIAQGGNIFAAAALGSAAYAIGESFAMLASFDNGGIVPKTGLIFAHQDEGVLTGPTTRMLTSVNKMVNSMDSNHLAAAAYAGGSAHPSLPPITIHVNGAQDPDLVAQKVSDAVFARVKRNFRTAGVSR